MKGQFRTSNYSLPRLMEMPVYMPLSLPLYSQSLVQIEHAPCNGTTFLILVSLYIRTYHLIAYFMLSSRLSFCTTINIRATTSPESALAVVSIRSVQRWPGLCIPRRHKLAKYMLAG